MYLETIITWLTTYKYFIVLPLTVAQGPTVMLVSGFLLRLDYFAFLPLYFTLMAGDFIGDLMWYGIGHFGARPFLTKYGKFFSVSPETLAKLGNLFAKHQGKILFISKITLGLGFAPVTLMTAGMIRVPLKRYALFNVLGGFIWTGFLVSIGYFFGSFYLVVAEGLRITLILGFTAVTVAAMTGLSRYMKRRISSGNL